MNQTTEEKIINELSFSIAQLSYENAKLKVLYNEYLEENERLKQSLERVNTVLENDKDLKELFDEVANKEG